MDVVLLVASFMVILAGALLFTNAVEWIGHRLGLGGAVGSLLAAVGTAMPETLIAIVALIGTTKSEDVAVGAIVGAPFLLATLAMGLVGLVAYIYRHRRTQEIELRAHVPTLDRDLIFFLVFFGLGLRSASARPTRSGSRPGSSSSWPIPSTSGARSSAAAKAQAEETLNPLIMDRRQGHEGDPSISIAALQFLVELGAMVGEGTPVRRGALEGRRERRRGGDRALADPRATLATELPEKVNSFFWVREGKDSRSGTSPARWSSSRPSRSGSGCSSPNGT